MKGTNVTTNPNYGKIKKISNFLDNNESKNASLNEARISKGDYLKKFQTLMYVNSKYFNLQKFFENKKQLKMENSEENFENEIKLLNKKRKKKKNNRLRRIESKGISNSFNKFKIFRKKKRLKFQKESCEKRFSSIDRKKIQVKNNIQSNQNSTFLIQSCIPLKSPAKRFSVLQSLILKKNYEKLAVKNKKNMNKSSNFSFPLNMLNSVKAKEGKRSSSKKREKSFFITTNKIKNSINTIRKKCKAFFTSNLKYWSTNPNGIHYRIDC
jgi:hypothetical protein